MQRLFTVAKNKAIKYLHITQKYILLSQSDRILLSLQWFTIHKDVFYSVAYILLMYDKICFYEHLLLV